MSDNADGDADPYHSQTVNSIQKEYFKAEETSNWVSMPYIGRKA